ncbi:MAG TPA: ATP-binding protein [Pseudolabrys sp.]|nr:ATP-binding protein [Pseudolabrys sp.]
MFVRAILEMRWTRAALACVAALILVTTGASAAEPRRVLLIHAFGHAYSPWSDMAGSFRADLVKKSGEPIDLYEVSLDTARIQNPREEAPFVEYIRTLFLGRKLDLIVPVGAPAAFFVQRHRSELFPATPMMVVGADQRRIPKASLSENDTAVLLDLDLPAYLRNILRVLPQTTEVAIVVGNSPVERYWTSQFVREVVPTADPVKISFLNDLTFDEMLKRAAAMPPHSAILWFLLSEDAAGVPYSEDRALDTMSKAASVPVFGMGDYQLGRGIIGGPLMQTQALGQQAADVALRILKGEKPSALNPPYVVFGAPIYDWRELRRWGISETRLSSDSIVQFREPGVWRQYRWQIIAIAGILLAQAAVITGLFLERRRRQVAELELRHRLMEVIHLNRTAVAGALSASVAHELNQPLGAIQSYAEAALLYLNADPPNVTRAQQILANILRDDQRASKIITHLRGLLKKRVESEMQEFDFNDVISDTVQIVGPEALKKGVDLSVHNANGALPVRGDRIQLQQVIMNLAMNGIDAMQGCGPGQGKMSIKTSLTEDSAVEVSVADSGSGIPPDRLNKIFDPFYTTKGHGTGLGLSIARTIVETNGGRIWAENRPGGGAMFCFTLPVSKAITA